MKRFQSMSQIADYLSQKAKISKTYGKYMASYVSSFTMIMKTCKGRDKICSIFQYLADLFFHCNKYSQFPQVRQSVLKGINTGTNVADKLRKSMKNSRKIFKFLKFIDHIASMVKAIESKKPLYLKFMTVLENMMSFFSNVFDNILWGINIQVLDVFFNEKATRQIKANKYFFSLCKIIFKMLGKRKLILGTNFKHHNRIKQMKQIIFKLRNYRQFSITVQNESYELCKNYLKNRQQVRIQELDGAIMIFRIIMLVRKLQLPGYTFVTKILYSSCGLISTILSVIKMVIDLPILVQLQEKEKTEKISDNKFEVMEKPNRIKINRSGTINFSEV